MRLDPEARAEARRYPRPIPSRALVRKLLRDRGVPLTLRDMAEALELDARERRGLEARLRAMVRDGELIRNRRGGFCLVDELDLVTGVVRGHPDGYGFVIPESGGDGDVYLPPRAMRELFDGDRVALRIVRRDRRGRAEGEVVEVLERRTETIVGRLFRDRGVTFVVPENRRIPHRIVVAPGADGGARQGQVVVVRLVEPPSRHGEPIGEVIQVLGEPDAPGMEIEIAIRNHGLPCEWPDEVRAEVRKLGRSLSRAALRDRDDLRELPLVTIDGEDARDFDDAVFCAPTPSGWRLTVAIADVAHYVEPGSALDREALRRGTSVYFTRRVLPMLPEELSNGLCSLRPEEDRLAVVCELLVSRDGSLGRARFREAVIRSRARLTYTEVAALLYRGDAALRRGRASLLPHLEELDRLYRALRRARRRRGAIDFDLPEAYIELGEDRRIESIGTYERNDAHRIIEECMIAVNVAAARMLGRRRLPTLYRVHDAPPPDKLEELADFLESLGIPFPRARSVRPLHFARVLDRVKRSPHRTLVETVMLRSMARACYDPDNRGHFGLALPEYVHFTSPIRRYPDLLVHRGIKHLLRGGRPRAFAYDRAEMERLGAHCSMTERRADDATREAIDWIKCEFMRDKVGEAFEGSIVGVTHFGLFVQLRDFFVEGLVRIASLPNDYYEFDARRHRLVGRRSGRVYQLASPLRVRVAQVDMEQRRIEFVPVEPPTEAPERPRRGRRPAPAGGAGGASRRKKGRTGGRRRRAAAASRGRRPELHRTGAGNGRSPTRRRAGRRAAADPGSGPPPTRGRVEAADRGGHVPRRRSPTGTRGAPASRARGSPEA